ncbi:lipoprotein NlpI [Psychromonas sp. 14N.309.X.WAT.B.A12]|jgi:lipoprotein NlpI|uniref:lipoprotein NlpI n=1 Tax=unclassified Psychromonas TaxID=2614957 RepID=UPI0025B09BC2|nr:lipoprotein NlpI [Psychromonas sp. 14N.309.X.WAT.B.A12]MDN2663132.1 lipoprotein NlpI [Psychromonas sp. 14N.309.X.WAT.B.A12]
MQISLKALFLVFSVVTLTACSSFNNENDSYTLAATGQGNSVFPIATPVQVTYQDEVKLLRLTQLISDKENIDDKQRAVLLYERGLIYDRMGLSAHSRYDFTQSINLDPTLAESYNSLGVYLLMGEAYDEAFDAFDSAIELSDTMQYSYLHRAIGLSLVGRLDGAQQDIEHFYDLDKTDPYRVLWRYIINSQVDLPSAEQQLNTVQREPEDKRFAWAIVEVINGDLSEEDFFDNIANGIQTNEELAQRLCEAYYYLAHWHMNNNALDKGIYYLKLSAATNVKDFIEYKYSLIDLGNIQKKLQAQVQKAQQAAE